MASKSVSGSQTRSKRVTFVQKPSEVSSRRAGSKRKASNLIASASKMLKSSNATSPTTNADVTRSKSASPTLMARGTGNQPCSHIPVKRGSRFPPLPSPLPPIPKRVPHNKPLPSLPIATIVTDFPVQRRSLIDAEERPLRRSASPQEGDSNQEDWPALSPERPRLSQYDTRLGDAVKSTKAIRPSVGESVIEAIRGLKLNDDSPGQGDSSSEKENRPQAQGAHGKMNDPQPSSSDTSHLSPNASLSRKPTGYRKRGQHGPPVVQLTKTYSNCKRLSVDDAAECHEPILGASQVAGKTYKLQQDGIDNNKDAAPRSIAPVGSKSRLRHTATGRGSPYTTPAPVSSLSSENIHRGYKSSDNGSGPQNQDAATPLDASAGTPRAHQAVANPASSSEKTSKRSASVPPSIDVTKESLGVLSDPDASACGKAFYDDSKASAAPVLENIFVATPKEAVDEVVNRPGSRIIPEDPARGQIFDNGRDLQGHITTPPSIDRVLQSDDEPEKSIRGWDEYGGFKIRRLRGRASIGATLRITDSAHKLLSTDGDAVDDDPKASGRRNSLILKEQLRKSSDMIKTQIQLTREITERSLARLSGRYSPELMDPERAQAEIQYQEGDSSSVIVKRASDADLAAENLSVAEISPKDFRASFVDKDLAATPTSIGQGDWPFKDFQTLARVSKEQATSESIDSSWNPPPNWEVNPGPDLSKLDLSSPSVVVPHHTPITAADQSGDNSCPAKQSKPEVKVPEAELEANDIPPPTPEKDITPARQYPPRISSRTNVFRAPGTRNKRKLSLVNEASEHDRTSTSATNASQYTPSTSRKYAPLRSFTRRMKEVNGGSNAVEESTPAHLGAVAPTTLKSSGKKKPMSTLRNLLHKKSGDIEGSLRAKMNRTRPALDTSAASSAATVTPISLSKMQSNNDQLSMSQLNQGSSPYIPLSKGTIASTPGPYAPVITPTPKSKTFSTHTVSSDEIHRVTSAALKLLDMARDERPGPRQNQLVELGEVTIQVISSAQDAQKALEQARAAAIRAEMYALSCQRNLLQVAGLVERIAGSES